MRLQDGEVIPYSPFLFLFCSAQMNMCLHKNKARIYNHVGFGPDLKKTKLLPLTLAYW